MWPGKKLIHQTVKFNATKLCRFFMSLQTCQHYIVQRNIQLGDQKRSLLISLNLYFSIHPAPSSDSGSNEDPEQPPKKRCGQYRSYSLQFKKIVMNELHELGSQVGKVAEKFNTPRSTLSTWEKQLSCQNKKES